MITNDEELAQNFNKHFVNIVPSLSITSFCENNDDANNDNIDNTITKCEDHPNIAAIIEQMKESNKTFIFQNVSATQKRLQNLIT